MATLALAVLPVAAVTLTTQAGAATGCPSAPSGVARTAPGPAKTVALTFDDGPGRDTGRILSILTANHVAATFFNLGLYEAGNAATVRAERAAGFALGDHTWDHQSLPSLSAAGQASEMDRERTQQAAITGAYPCLFRPPYGSYNATTLLLAQHRGMRVWNWSVDTEDWKAAGSGDAFWVNRITARAIAGGSQTNPVILMHNQAGGNPATVSALPAIISYYRSHGYRFVDLYGRTALPAPAIHAVTPNAGRAAGGTRLTVSGSGFSGVTSVRFGTTPGTTLHVVSSTLLYITTPRHTAGTVNVQVSTTHGTSPAVRADYFTYVSPPAISALSPASGSTSGGTRVAVSGVRFGPGTTVRFGGAAGTSVTVTSSTRLYVTTPAHTPGVLNVTVSTPYGASPAVRADYYTYMAPPVISALSPASGPSAGGTRVTVSGAHFDSGTTVRFGGAAGTNVVVTSSTTLSVTAPAHTPGVLNVTAANRYGTSPAVRADYYTYVAPPAPAPQAPPTVSAIVPNIGPVAGGTPVTVTGSGFIGVTSVTFGGVPGTGLVVMSPTELRVNSPLHDAGPVVVQVSTPAGTGSAADGFTFS